MQRNKNKKKEIAFLPGHFSSPVIVAVTTSLAAFSLFQRDPVVVVVDVEGGVATLLPESPLRSSF